jgi:hypothetical protein
VPRSFSLLVPVLLFAAAAVAQSPATSSPAPAAPSQNPAPPGETKKSRKVWTNDNLSDASGAISVVGDPQNAPKAKPAAQKAAEAQYIASIRKQLDKLQAQIADLDKQLADLKKFSEGEPSSSASGIKLNKSYNREPIEVQIRALEQKKKDLQEKTDALTDEARKKGVEPGELR